MKIIIVLAEKNKKREEDLQNKLLEQEQKNKEKEEKEKQKLEEIMNKGKMITEPSPDHYHPFTFPQCSFLLFSRPY